MPQFESHFLRLLSSAFAEVKPKIIFNWVITSHQRACTVLDFADFEENETPFCHLTTPSFP